MYDVLPIVLDKKLYIGIGTTCIKYIAGETKLDTNNEREIWERAAELSCMQELLSACRFLVSGKTIEAETIAKSIIECLERAKKSYPACVTNFKRYIYDVYKLR